MILHQIVPIKMTVFSFQYPVFNLGKFFRSELVKIGQNGRGGVQEEDEEKEED